jgi:hypothetical protein
MFGRSGTGASALSIIPLHLQRRFERQWAGRFGSLVIPGATKERRIQRLAGQRAPRAEKDKENPAGLRLKAKGK